MEIIKMKGCDATIISDRCIETNKEVFASMLYGDGLMTKQEFELYLEYYNMNHIAMSPIKCFINTSPSLCHHRIKQRNRIGEEEISMDYLNALDLRHKAWLDDDFIKFDDLLKIL